MTNPRGRPKKHKLVVSDTQIRELKELVQRSRSHRALSFRARLILLCASGKSNSAAAAQLKTTPTTVGFWCKRFIAGGMDSLWDEPRPGAPRQIGDDEVERVVKLTLESTPKGATHWSTRGKGPRYCRAVHESTGSCPRALCGREKPNSGAESHPTHLAHAAGTGGAPES